MVKPLWAEIRDQVLHVAVAILLTAMFIYFPELAAAVLAMGIGIIRELIQHNWQAVGRLDLVFWGVGCALALLGYCFLFWMVGDAVFAIGHHL
jgi:hypothetical protein